MRVPANLHTDMHVYAGVYTHASAHVYAHVYTHSPEMVPAETL